MDCNKDRRITTDVETQLKVQTFNLLKTQDGVMNTLSKQGG